MERPSLRGIASVFLRVSSLTFGSGNATSALLRRELVDERGWLGPSQFALSFAIARVTPGTNMLAFVTGAGWYMRGMAGGTAALLASSMPASVVTVLLTILYQAVQSNRIGVAAASAAMAAVVGLIVGGAWLILQPYFDEGHHVRNLLLLLGAMVLFFRFGLTPIPIVFASAAVGFFWPAREAS